MKLDVYIKADNLIAVIVDLKQKIKKDIFVSCQRYEVFGDNIGDSTDFLINIFIPSITNNVYYKALLNKSANFSNFIYLLQKNGITYKIIPGLITERSLDDKSSPIPNALYR